MAVLLIAVLLLKFRITNNHYQRSINLCRSIHKQKKVTSNFISRHDATEKTVQKGNIDKLSNFLNKYELMEKHMKTYRKVYYGY